MSDPVMSEASAMSEKISEYEAAGAIPSEDLRAIAARVEARYNNTASVDENMDPNDSQMPTISGSLAVESAEKEVAEAIAQVLERRKFVADLQSRIDPVRLQKADAFEIERKALEERRKRLQELEERTGVSLEQYRLMKIQYEKALAEAERLQHVKNVLDAECRALERDNLL